jgi:S-disulfanyl-L-cysteine oxidoreductase SoxD
VKQGAFRTGLRADVSFQNIVRPRLITLVGPSGVVLPFTPLAAWSFPWDVDMYRGPAVQPLSRAPRNMPAETMPTERGRTTMSTEQMTVKLKNPMSPTPESLAHGKDLFITNCSPCHGESGSGNGPVAHFQKDPPKDLVTGQSKYLPDGYIYGVIRNGILLKPSYADAMSSSERWQVVLYIRSLQSAAASVQPRDK